MRALIVEDGNSRGALAALRDLHRAGWSVAIAAPRRGPAGWSRYSDRYHVVPGPQHGISGFVGAVADVVERHAYEVVFGGGDAEVLALSAHRGSIGAVVPYPDHGSVLQALDKAELGRAAQRVGLATPATVAATPESIESAEFPIVLKSRSRWVLGTVAPSGRVEGGCARDRSEAMTLAERIRRAGGEPVLQEFVDGGLMSYAVLVDGRGAVVAEIQQVAEATWPPRMGVSVRAVSVPVDRGLAADTVDLLRELRWFGLAQLQFLVDQGGRPLLVDLNPRFYGSMALAGNAGVHLPAAWAALATGRLYRSIPSAPPGIRYHWLEGDLRRAWEERRGGLLDDLAGCVRCARSEAVGPIWDARDPVPAIVTAVELGRRAVWKLLGMVFGPSERRAWDAVVQSRSSTRRTNGRTAA